MAQNLTFSKVSPEELKRLEAQYAAPPQVGTLEGAQKAGTAPVEDAYRQFISDPLDKAADWLRTMHTSNSTPTRGLNGAAGPLTNEGILGNIMAAPLEVVAHPKDNAPIIGGIAGDATAALLSRGASLPATLARRGLLGGLGQMTGGIIQRDGDTSHAQSDFLWGGVPGPATHGAATLIGKLGQKGGRGAAFAALGPTETEMAELYRAKYGTLEGFNVGKGEQLVKDDVFDRGGGAIGGQRFASGQRARSDASEAGRQGVISQTREETTAPWQLGDGQVDNFKRMMASRPKPEFSIDLRDAEKGFDTLRAQKGGMAAGSNPSGALAEIDSARGTFFNRPPDTREFTTPLSGAMPESLTGKGAPSTMTLEDMRSLRETVSGFIKDAEAAGGISADTAQWRQILKELDAGIPPRVGFDANLNIINELDDDVMRAWQTQATQGAKQRDFVPSPGDRAKMTMAGNLRDSARQVAPMGEVGGQPIGFEDLMRNYSQDIQWRQMADRATGGQSGGYFSGGASASGKPFVRAGEGLGRLMGPLARPLYRGGQAIEAGAKFSSPIYRLLQAINQNQGRHEK